MNCKRIANMNKAHVFLIVITLLISVVHAQEIKKSVTYVDTYYHGEKHFSIKEASQVFYDATNGDIKIKINFSQFKCGVDSIDEWLEDLTGTELIFTGHLPTTDLIALTHHNTKTMELPGILAFNNQTHAVKINFGMYEISKEGILYKNTGQDLLDRIAANILIIIHPKDFGINKKPHHLTKKISIAIGRAFLNNSMP